MAIAGLTQAKTNGKPSVDELMAQVAALQAQLAKKNTITLKVSDKGGVSAYGLGRYPVTLYREQWERLLGAKEEILDFIGLNIGKLSTK